MKTYYIKVTVRRMGRPCQTCSQQATGYYDANSMDEAIALMKSNLTVDLDTHQVMINIIKEV